MKKTNHVRDFKKYLIGLSILWGGLILFVLAPLFNLDSLPANYMDVIECFGRIIIAVGMLFAVLPFAIIAKLEIDRLSKLK